MAVHVARADLLLKSGDSESAAAVASSATAEDPDNPVLLLLQGEAHQGGKGGASRWSWSRCAARRLIAHCKVHVWLTDGHRQLGEGATATTLVEP
jgi:hypothetical protein